MREARTGRDRGEWEEGKMGTGFGFTIYVVETHGLTGCEGPRGQAGGRREGSEWCGGVLTGRGGATLGVIARSGRRGRCGASVCVRTRLGPLSTGFGLRRPLGRRVPGERRRGWELVPTQGGRPVATARARRMEERRGGAGRAWEAAWWGFGLDWGGVGARDRGGEREGAQEGGGEEEGCFGGSFLRAERRRLLERWRAGHRQERRHRHPRRWRWRWRRASRRLSRGRVRMRRSYYSRFHLAGRRRR